MFNLPEIGLFQVVETPIQTSSPVPPVSAEPSEDKTEEEEDAEYGYTLGKSGCTCLIVIDQKSLALLVG